MTVLAFCYYVALVLIHPVRLSGQEIIVFTSLIKAHKGANRERGQGLIEYALILILIAIAVIVILGSLGQTLKSGMYDKINCGVSSAIGEDIPADC